MTHVAVSLFSCCPGSLDICPLCRPSGLTSPARLPLSRGHLQLMKPLIVGNEKATKEPGLCAWLWARQEMNPPHSQQKFSSWPCLNLQHFTSISPSWKQRIEVDPSWNLFGLNTTILAGTLGQLSEWLVLRGSQHHQHRPRLSQAQCIQTLQFMTRP